MGRQRSPMTLGAALTLALYVGLLCIALNHVHMAVM